MTASVAAKAANPISVAVLGTGMMGFPMAQRLCAAGHRVHVWNRTRAKAEPLAAAGANVHRYAADAVRHADITISLLENGPVVADVLFAQGAAQALRPGSLYIEMASIQPSEARDHAARLGEMGVSHLDAPVSGGTVGAEAGTLAIMAGGKAVDFQRALVVLNALGRATHVGPHGTGQLAKLANQMIVGITIVSFTPDATGTAIDLQPAQFDTFSGINELAGRVDGTGLIAASRARRYPKGDARTMDHVTRFGRSYQVAALDGAPAPASPTRRLQPRRRGFRR